MGFEDECFRETVDSMIDRALESPNPRLRGITRGRLEREHFIRLNFEGNEDSRRAALGGTDEGVRPHAVRDASTDPFLPFAQGNFPTPSGKAESPSQTLRRQALD